MPSMRLTLTLNILSILLVGCTVAHDTVQTSSFGADPLPIMLSQSPHVSSVLTLSQIMANPDWMGILAKNAYWSDDSQSVVFARQGSTETVAAYYLQGVHDTAAVELSLDKRYQAVEHGVFNADKSCKAYIYQGNLFVKELASGHITQLTRQHEPIKGMRYLTNGDLVYWQQHQVFRRHNATGLVELLADIRLKAAPRSLVDPSSYLAKQQHRLINYVALQHTRAQSYEAHQQILQRTDPTQAAPIWYLGTTNAEIANSEADDIDIADLSVSADGRYVFLALATSNYPKTRDIMPNYVGSEGYIDAVPVRSRVADSQSSEQQFVLLDLQQHQQVSITLAGLRGINEDVFTAVKAENASALGDAYQWGNNDKPAVRHVRLMQDWGWQQSAIQWHESGNQLALMLEAVDNKDRWIALVDLASGALTTEHRLHDVAWVNYDYNQFGWLPKTDLLYYLSEETGYSHLYVKALGEAPRALTQGHFVVSDITVGPNAKYIYYKANVTHPGIYNVYRVNVATGAIEQLTQWQGNLDYRLSPDGTRLLLQASSRTQPAELYVQEIGGQLTQLTTYASEAFTHYPWQVPEVVRVPSSHGARDIYARVYLPQGFDNTRTARYPAVMFNHGAGYLQNAHYGFSGYFREFMYHNMLTQKGYVVIDMDYRGSKGYGRDWRTAIYRNMGHPEIEDLQDGVRWLVDNAHVDPHRVGTYGGSYGGFLTLMALFTEPDLFQVGAALRPVTDWAHYNAPYTSNILNTPDVDPLAYRRSSPIEYGQELTKPLLIMSGVLDDNVFFQDSVRMVQRLIELEKPMFDIAIYPVEPHGFRQPSSWLDEYRRIDRLFDTVLMHDRVN